MDEDNIPQCSNVQKAGQVEVREENEKVPPSQKPINVTTPEAQSLKSSNFNQARTPGRPLTIQASSITPIMTQPRAQSNLTLSQHSALEPNRPLPLFLQALTKLNENSLNLAGLTQNKAANLNYGNVTPPSSLGNAPPSYSFVLRQMAGRRRPRLMGTFIPSPSFVQHTPPPNYATAFDIYMDPLTQPPPARVYHYGFTSTPMVCPECGYAGMTVITSKVTMCTHMCAFILCLLCCWICVPLPYILKSCKDVYHHCRNCRSYLGMYCPTNPDSAYMSP